MNKIFNFQALLLEKVQLNDHDYKLVYKVPNDFFFKPGQFVGIRVNPNYTRAYSIVSLEDSKLELLVDVKPMGLASKYFIDTQVGDTVQMLGPYGIYGLKSNLPNKVFIATGTGIAPFIPMIRSLNKLEISSIILFGCKSLSEDIAYPYFKDNISLNLKYIQCITREEPKVDYAKVGRVTKILQEMFVQNIIDKENTDFYICRSKEMINDVIDILKSNQVDKYYFEKF